MTAEAATSSRPALFGRAQRLVDTPAWLVYAAIAVGAFAIRLLPVLLGSGLHNQGNYDDGVYYTAADSLTFGRLPYRDFTLLHPPGLPLVLTPFALLGRFTQDSVGMATGRVFFMGVGAANALLVTVLARRWGWRSGLVAGVLYAVWSPAVFDEQLTLLEPLGSLATLVALLLLVNRRDPPTRRAEFLAGITAGFAVTMKIWYAAPLLLFVLWPLASRRWRSALTIAAGATLSMLVILLPFVVLAGHQMFDMVVKDQLLRHPAASSRLDRVSSIAGLRDIVGVHGTSLDALSMLALLAFAAAAVLCLTDPSARFLAALLAVDFVVLMLSPSFFPHYGALTASPAALVLGVGFSRVTGLRRRLNRRVDMHRVVTVTLLVVFAIYGVRILGLNRYAGFAARKAFIAAMPTGCVVSDKPALLVEMNVLSRDLRENCRVLVDVTGITYGALHRVGPDGKELDRERNRPWQNYIVSYLTHSSAFVVGRPQDDRFSPTSAATLLSQPLIVRGKSLVLRHGLEGYSIAGS